MFRRREPEVVPDVLGALSRVSGMLVRATEAVGVPVLRTTGRAGWMDRPDDRGPSVGMVTVRVETGAAGADDSVASAAKLALELGLPSWSRRTVDDQERVWFFGWCEAGSGTCPVRLEVTGSRPAAVSLDQSREASRALRAVA